jgi:hypothetical protein
VSSLGLRIVGFVACLIIYGYFAMGVFVQMMMGDCDTGVPTEHAACEAARSNNLLVLIVVTLIVAALLIWAFFVAGRRKGKAE